MVLGLLRIFIFIMTTSLNASDHEMFTVEGSSRIETSSEQARERAVISAYKNAVRKALVLTYGETKTRTNEAKLLFVYENPKNYVLESQQIMEQEDNKLKMFSVKLDVTIDIKAIKEAILGRGIVLSTESSFTILPLIVERQGPYQETYWWHKGTELESRKSEFSDMEKAIAIYFAKAGYAMLDPYLNSYSEQIPSTYKFSSLTAKERLQIGRDLNVGMVASGYIESSCKDEKLARLVNCETVLYLQILSVDSGRIIASKRVTETGASQNNIDAKTISRAKAVQTVCSSILNQLKKKGSKKKITGYTISFTGIKNPTTYVRIKNCLSSDVKGLSNLMDRKMSKEEIIFEAERSGTEDLAYSIREQCLLNMDAEVVKSNASQVEFAL